MTDELSFVTEIGKDGRITIPKNIRGFYDLEKGDQVVLKVKKTKKDGDLDE